MKSLSIMLVVMILAGCSSMGLSSGGGGGMSSSDPRNQMNINRHDDPRDIYFGG